MPTPTPIPTPLPTPLPPDDVLITHLVREGQNLNGIAGTYGISVDEIKAVNQLRNDVIRVDQELLIPVKRTQAERLKLNQVKSTFTYTVQDGDTVISIATLFGANVNDILAQNGLAATDIIRLGQILVIPVRNVPGQVLESANAEGADGGPRTDARAGDDENRIYLAPSLTGPPDSSTLSRNEPVLLRWVSVDVLAPNEWYVVQIYSAADAAGNPGVDETFPTIWTKTTSYRLGTELAPPPDQSVTYTWRVSVIRVRASGDGRGTLEPTSPPSSARIFTWQ